MLLLTSSSTLIALTNVDEPDVIRIVVYRGPAACDGCAETVKDAIERLGRHYHVDLLGPNESLDVSTATLARYSAQVQPGGGQYLGPCKGACLADVDSLGLIDTALDSKRAHPGSRSRTSRHHCAPEAILSRSCSTPWTPERSAAPFGAGAAKAT